MGRFETMNTIVWPPVGWAEFAQVGASSGRAVAKDIAKARIFGLNYSIDSVPIFKMDQKLMRHDIVVDGWDYSILNESHEYPILSFSIYDRFDLGLAKECFVSDIRSYGTLIPHTKRSVSRAISAALFTMRQINGGVVPDINRVLRTYKLHPNQAVLYCSDKAIDYPLKEIFAGRPLDSSQF